MKRLLLLTTTLKIDLVESTEVMDEVVFAASRVGAIYYVSLTFDELLR